MNDTKQSHWTLLQRPWWKTFLVFAVSFAVFFFFAVESPSYPRRVGVTFVATLSYILLFDLLRLFIAWISTRHGIRVAVALVGVGFGLWLGFLLARWGPAHSWPRDLVALIQFTVTTAFGAACGASLVRAEQTSNGQAN